MITSQSGKTEGFLRPFIWMVYMVLVVAGIPWYWGESGMTLFLGFPLWVVVSLSASLVASLFTAYIIWKIWPDDEDEGGAH